MPHRCMNCGILHEDESKELIEGCQCGSSLFMYESSDQDTGETEVEQAQEIVEDAVRSGPSDTENVKFKFNLDSIAVQEEGVYDINISKLLDEVPIIVKKQEGSYHLHLPSAFNPENKSVDKNQLNE